MFSRLIAIAAASGCLIGLAACQGEESSTEPANVTTETEVTAQGAYSPDAPAAATTPAETTAPDEAGPDATPSPIIDVVTREYTIEMPDEMALGWNTFRFSNQGDQTHFVLMYRLAPDKTIEDQRTEVVPAFDALMEGLRAAEISKDEIGPFLTENIPAWGLQMTYIGGAGLLAPGLETQSTFHVDTPGIYLVECYVKAPDGTWHTSMGMLHQVEVLDQPGGGEEPVATARVTVGNDGVMAPATLPAGLHTIRVDIVDDAPTFMPYDLNLARLDEETDLGEIAFWMDWSNVGGLRAPAPVEFLGGVEHMNAGNHGYMTVNLEPGRYLWISEIEPARTQAAFVVKEP